MISIIKNNSNIGVRNLPIIENISLSFKQMAKHAVQKIILNVSNEISQDKNSSPPCATAIQRGMTPNAPSKESTIDLQKKKKIPKTHQVKKIKGIENLTQM